MPEVSEDAAIFLATSYQALERARRGNERTLVCECTIALICACFYVEETIDLIIDKMGKKEAILSFYKFKEYKKLGMFKKFEWFYKSYIEKENIDNKNKLPGSSSPIKDNLEIMFPGFNKIHDFRNDVSHGNINHLANLIDTLDLRQRAKDIVAKLLRVASDAGYHIPRDITFKMAIDNFNNRYADN